MTDPFEVLRTPYHPRTPGEDFARRLRARIVTALGLDDGNKDIIPTITLFERSTAMPAASVHSFPTTTATMVTPYLTVTDGVAALDWYTHAFGATEAFRVVGDDGRIGHAEFAIGKARFMLSDEYPEMGVSSPTSLGGSPVALHVSVTAVDELFDRAVAAGATSLLPPADQPHGARHGTLLDPYGHRWMLSQPLEDLDLETYRQRTQGTGYVVEPSAETSRVREMANALPRERGGIWAAVFYRDALEGIRFLVDVFGFSEQLVITGADDRTVVHSELRWPEGGIVQAGSYDSANVYALPPGQQSLYVVTADPRSVWERSQTAGVEVVRPPESPEYDPTGFVFSVRDPEANVWTFGSYGLQSS
jgi:PhnB protein